MGTRATGPPDDDPRLAGFEHAAEPAFVTEGGQHRIVALNAAGRALWGESALGADVGTALPGLDRDELDCWPWVLQSRTPVEVRTALGPHGEPAMLDLRPWQSTEGPPRGVVTRLRSDLSSGAVATRMQEALLPEELPVLPRLDLAATYLLADGDEGAAGDWFDAVLTPSGDVALVVGDVAGRGTEAVATMATAQAVVRERLRTGRGPAEALGALGSLVEGLPRAATTTVVLAVLDPETGEVTYCTAGHPGPIVVDPDGGAWRLPATGAAALGIAGPVYPARSHTLAPGQMLLLHSDGLAETGEQADAVLTEVLHEAVASIGGGHGIRGTVDRVCERVLADPTARNGDDDVIDDVVLLVAERMPLAAPLELFLPAEPGSVREARLRLWEWLDDLRPGELDVSALLHATGELVANAVEHAYAGRDMSERDPVVLCAHLSQAGEVMVTVRDRGRWRSAASEPSGRGRGLVMAAGLVDHLDLDRGEGGTTATLRHRIGRPVTVSRTRPTGRTARAGAAFDTVAAGSGRMLVRGEVDEQSAGVLRVALLHHTGAGTAPVVADLSEISLLSSAGVRVLAEAVAWGSGSTVVALAAAPGSVAARVLDAVGLPYGAG